jgi:hypothetical protein
MLSRNEVAGMLVDLCIERHELSSPRERECAADAMSEGVATRLQLAYNPPGS